MSKYNINSPDSKSVKSNDFDLEASNQFTLKGEDEQYEAFQSSGSKFDILSDKKSKSNNSNSSHHSIKILNLSEFSFCGNEHKFNIFENEINNENRNDVKRVIIEGLKKINIIPIEKNTSNVVKIRFTKAKTGSPKRNKYIAMNEIKECISEIKSDDEKDVNEKDLNSLVENIISSEDIIETDNNIKTNLYELNKKEIENMLNSIELMKIIDDVNNISCVVVMEIMNEIVDKVFEYLEIKEQEKCAKEMEKFNNVIQNMEIHVDMDIEKEKNDENIQTQIQKNNDSISKSEINNIIINNHNKNNDTNITEKVDNQIEKVNNGYKFEEIKNDIENEIASGKKDERVKVFTNIIKIDEDRKDIKKSESLNADNNSTTNIRNETILENKESIKMNSLKEKNNTKMKNNEISNSNNQNSNGKNKTNIINEITNNMEIENVNGDNDIDDMNMIQKEENKTELKVINTGKNEKVDDITEKKEKNDSDKDIINEIIKYLEEKNEIIQSSEQEQSEKKKENKSLVEKVNNNISKIREEMDEKKMEIEEEKNKKETEEKKEKEQKEENSNKNDKVNDEEKIEKVVEEEKMQKVGGVEENLLLEERKEEKIQIETKKDETMPKEEKKEEKIQKVENKEEKEKKAFEDEKIQANEVKIQNEQKNEKNKSEQKNHNKENEQKEEKKIEKEPNIPTINNKTPKGEIENNKDINPKEIITPKGEQEKSEKEIPNDNQMKEKPKIDKEKDKNEIENETEKDNYPNLPPANTSLHSSKEKESEKDKLENYLIDSISSLIEEKYKNEEKREKWKDERNSEKSEKKINLDESNEYKSCIKIVSSNLNYIFRKILNEKSHSKRKSNSKKSEGINNKKGKEKEEKKDKGLFNEYNLLGRKRHRENMFSISDPIEVEYLHNAEEKENRNREELKKYSLSVDRNKKKSLSNKKNNNNIMHKNDIQIIEEEKYDINDNSDSESDNKYIFNFNNKKDKEIFKLILKCAYELLYRKINNKSFSNNNNLDKEIIAMINTEGYSTIIKMINSIKTGIHSLTNENELNSKELELSEKDSYSYIDENEIKHEEYKDDEFHYNIINNSYYRYNLVNTEDNYQRYACSLNGCNCIAMLNIEQRKFEIIKNHSKSPDQHTDFKDVSPVKFMRKKKLEQIHIKKNRDNISYHLEWFS